MFLIQDVPLETTHYMIAGYAVIFTIMLLYLASLFIRSRNLKQDMQVLQQIEAQESRIDSGYTPSD